MNIFTNIKELKRELANAMPFPKYDRSKDWYDVLEGTINRLTINDNDCLKIYKLNPELIEKVASKTLVLADPMDLKEHKYRTIVREAFYTLCFDSSSFNKLLYENYRYGKTEESVA